MFGGLARTGRLQSILEGHSRPRGDSRDQTGQAA